MLTGCGGDRAEKKSSPRTPPPDPLDGLSETSREMIGALRQYFDELDIDEAALIAFARDQQRHRKSSTEVTHGLAQRFLLSTDFFQHGADTSRRIGYARFYDPYVSVCYNPLRPV